MKYFSCPMIESFFLNFNGRIDAGNKSLGLCCEPLNDKPSIEFSGDVKSMLSQLIRMRDGIIEESRECAFGLLADRRHSAGCANCANYQENQWTSDGLIHYVNLSMYPAPCQCKCIYCGIQKDKEMMNAKTEDAKKSYEKLFEMLEYALEHGMIAPDAIWQVSSGEISIHPYKDRIFELIKGRTAIFYTNCFIYDEQIAENLHNNPNSAINLSIDAGLPQTWYKVKGVDNFEQIMENLTKYFMATTRKGQISLKYIVLPGINDTYEDYQSLIEIMKTIQVPHLTISRDTTKKYDVHNKEFEELIGASGYLLAMCHKNNISNDMFTFTPEERKMVIEFAKELLKTGQV